MAGPLLGCATGNMDDIEEADSSSAEDGTGQTSHALETASDQGTDWGDRASQDSAGEDT